MNWDRTGTLKSIRSSPFDPFTLVYKYSKNLCCFSNASRSFMVIALCYCCCEMIARRPLAPKWNRGFHVSSYQANFESQQTRDRHIGFLFAWDGIGNHNEMFQYISSSPYYITKLQLIDRNISTHTQLVEISNPSMK